MKKQLLLYVLLVASAACQREGDVQPVSSLTEQVVGTYQTNGYVDVLNISLPSDKMPSAELKASSDTEVTLIFTKQYPVKEVKKLDHVTLSLQPDQSIVFRVDGAVIGSLQTDRVFTASGMETEGKLLRINGKASQGEVNFTGYKQ